MRGNQVDQEETEQIRPIFSRRYMLAMAGGTALAATLAACSSSSSGSTTTAAPATTAGNGATTTTMAGATTTAAATGSGNAAKFGGGGGDGTLKIGFTAPITGPLAGFGEANDYILGQINELAADGLMLGDKSYKVEIIFKDIESNSDTAASRASELILDEGVDLILSIATPEMINPVADQCEANGVPCMSTLAPWQPYFFGRGGDPATGFEWTYHFFWGDRKSTRLNSSHT